MTLPRQKQTATNLLFSATFFDINLGITALLTIPRLLDCRPVQQNITANRTFLLSKKSSYSPNTSFLGHIIQSLQDFLTQILPFWNEVYLSVM
jgi:hypothetical protein